MSCIPFDSEAFTDAALEEFVEQFLNAGISLPIDGPLGVEERRVLRAWRDHPRGGAEEGGIDVFAEVEGGERWGFQCKLMTRGKDQRWTLSRSRKVEKKLNVPVDRFFLVVIAPRGQQREARELIESHKGWQFWTQSILTSLFFTKVRREVGLCILRDLFGPATASRCYELLEDEVLIPSERFYQSLLRENRAFNHRAEFIGTRATVDAIHGFIERSDKKVLLLAGPGGVGKSRILYEVTREFRDRHPRRTLRFVNPAAPEQRTESLGVLIEEGLVVIHEDAHRVEGLRPSVLSAIASKEGAQIILSVRPQGIDAVRQTLTRYGIRAEDIEPQAVVQRLGQSDMIRLAEAVLGPQPLVEPHVLAGWSDRSPLVCVVGGNLIRTQSLSPRDIPNSQVFRSEVFDRFEEQNLAALAGNEPEHRRLLERMLRIVAVLAPLPDEEEFRNRLAEFLEVRGSVVETSLAELETAELIVKTEKGWRVTPDLFADHLVFESCFNQNRPSAFIREIIEAFRHSHFASLLRNLSEAEWRARIEEKGTVKLTDSLWKTFEQSFRKSSFWERRTLLEAWAPFSVFLPERTIELAKLAVSLDEAPDDEAAKLLSFQSSTWRNMVDRVPMILKPIGIYHLKLQFEVFDLLAQLGKDWQFKVEFQTREDDGHPWSAIAAAADFAIDQPVESVGGVVRWLESRLEADWMSDLIDRRGGFLNLILHPIFKRAIERTYSEGMKFVFQTIPLSVENTAPMRDAAFQLIEEMIVPRSEVATLNVIPVLNETAAFYGVGPDQYADRDKWKPVRLRAISLLDFCRSRWSSSFVQFAVWRALANRISFEKDNVIVEAGKDALKKIPRDLMLKTAFVALDEGGHCRFNDNLDDPVDWENSWEQWKEFPPKVARELFQFHTDERSIWDFLNHFDAASRKCGYVPNWSPLLIALTDERSGFAEGWIERCLRSSESFLEGSIGTLLFSVNANDPEAGDRLIADALRSGKENVRNSAMGMFRWSMHPPGKASIAVLRDLLGSTNQSVREPVLIAFCDPLSHGRGWTHEMVDAIPFERLNEVELSQVVSSLVSAVQFERIELDLNSLAALFKRLELAAQIHNDPYPAFFRFLSEKSPRKTYEIIRNRIVRFENEFQPKKDYSFNPVVKELEPWRIPGLEQEGEFSEIVEFLVGKMRNLDVPAAHYWTNLFQAAVLLNQTDLGIESLRTWLSESKDFEEVREVARVFNLRGSSLAFSHPAFVREVISHVLRDYPQQMESIYWALLPNTGMRSYSNGELDASCHWVIDEARKASAQFAGDAVLKPFFEFVIDREERDQKRNRERYQADMLAMA